MNKQAGFTLIELVAVLVILALLGAMAVPRFVDMQSQALDAARNGTKNAVKSAHSLYIAENRSLPTVTNLAAYVTADGAVSAVNNGVEVVIDTSSFVVQTYTDTTCTTLTTSTTGATGTVRCVGDITP
jgi:MSHA pilin protein MshA